jgi:hypothetical protein
MSLWDEIVFMRGLFILIPIAIGIATEIFMRMQVNANLPAKEQFLWWRRYGFQVIRKYRELHPGSVVPWVQLACFFGTVAWVLLLTYWRK